VWEFAYLAKLILHLEQFQLISSCQAKFALEYQQAWIFYVGTYNQNS
jgi:hypothetical protein